MNIPVAVGDRIRSGFGPARGAATTSRAASSRAAARVLELLDSAPGPTTATTLARSAGLHPNTIREQLGHLAESGLVTRQRAAVAGRGRPSWLYAPAREHGEAGGEYAGLATVLALQLARSSPRPREAALEAGERWGAELVTTGPGTGSAGPGQARRRVVSMLRGLGFSPDPDHRTDVVRLRTCPLLDAAAAQPDVVCGVHLGIVRGALATLGADPDRADLLPFAERGACQLRLLSGHSTGRP